MEVASFPTIEVRIYPPLSYKMTSQKVGPLIKTIKIQQETTLSDLLDKLDAEDHEAWRRIYDREKKRMRLCNNLH